MGGLELRWIVSLSASACHAAEIALAETASGDPLAAAIAGPARTLVNELSAAGIDRMAFWRHLPALAVEIENNRLLAEAVLRKILLSAHRSADMISPLAGRIADLEAATRAAVPGLLDELVGRAEQTRARWEEGGPSLVARIVNLTDLRTRPSAAKMAPVWPCVGAAGEAHLDYNLVRLELPAEDDPRALPQTVQLAWLVAQLNLDLPLFTETIPVGRRSRVARLAMLPPALAAAEEAGLLAFDEGAIERALGAWSPTDARQAAIVALWWRSYLDSRPAWNVALAALDQMIGE